MAHEENHHHHHHHTSSAPEIDWLSGIIPDGVDLFTVLFILVAAFSGLCQLIYLISPQALKKLIEHYDWHAPQPGKSGYKCATSTLISLFFLVLSFMFIG